ncbi:MAG TPA: hypothetical protein VFQ61_30180 [Polyangiaceae bacterium]|nr:hypothetical protein [Polyangiaceae bacterium]
MTTLDSVASPSAAGAKLWAITGEFAPALWQRSGRLRFGLGLALQVGWIHASSFGIRAPRAANAPWYAVAPALMGQLEVSPRVHLRLSIEGTVALGRPRFEIDGVGVVYEAPRFVPILGLSAGFDVQPVAAPRVTVPPQ